MGERTVESELRLSDEALARAVGQLSAAAEVMAAASEQRPPGELPSLSGIGADVSGYLRGASLARASLADAAKTAGRAVNELMLHSDLLDARAASALQRGFAVPKG